MFFGKISLNLLLLLLLVYFCNGFKLDLMYISLIVSIRSSLTHLLIFSCLCCCHSYRNHFLVFYQQNKCAKSIAKFRRASNRCKRVLEAAKRAYANKIKSQSMHKNLPVWTFDELPVLFSTKVNPLYLLCSMAQGCCLFRQIKQNCLPRTFLRTVILMTQVYLCLFSLLELI